LTRSFGLWEDPEAVELTEDAVVWSVPAT
jgi:hypothetical protein